MGSKSTDVLLDSASDEAGVDLDGCSTERRGRRTAAAASRSLVLCAAILLTGLVVIGAGLVVCLVIRTPLISARDSDAGVLGGSAVLRHHRINSTRLVEAISSDAASPSSRVEDRQLYEHVEQVPFSAISRCTQDHV